MTFPDSCYLVRVALSGRFVLGGQIDAQREQRA